MDNQNTKLVSTAKQSNAVQVKLSEFVKVLPIEKEDRKGWVNYGENNAYPNYIIELYRESPVHGALVNSIAFMIAGNGLETSIQAVGEAIERLKLEKILFPIAIDLKMQGGCYLEVIYSFDRTTISEVNYLPYENCRLSKTADEEVNGVWYSNDWKDIRKKRNAPEYIPFFDINKAQEEPKQILFFHIENCGAGYYPKPDYIQCLNWVELTRHISEYHVNNILNGLFPSFMIHFMNGDQSSEAKAKIKEDWEEMISGVQNAGKFIMTFNEDESRAPRVDTFPISDADKQYQYLSDEATKQIMIGHRVTSPLLFGIREAGGLGSNKDEMKSALAIFNTYVIKPYQDMIVEAMGVIMEALGLPSDITIKKKTLWEEEVAIDSKAGDTSTSTPQAVATQALNGAQIGSLLEIITQTTANVLTIPSAKAITRASFPFLTEEQIGDIFDNLSSVEIAPEQVLQGAEKKKTNLEDGYEPTDEMSKEAELGLEWRREYGRGGTAVGVARARDISNKKNLSFDTVKRMYSYFSRHEVDKQATGWNNGEEGFPTAGRIAWQLWGGDAGFGWAERIVNREKENQSAIPEMTEQDEENWLNHLASCGELIDESEWELVNEEDINPIKEERLCALRKKESMFTKSFSNPEDKSVMDSGIFKVRYAYSKNISDNSRKFCQKMVSASKQGLRYRYEDINNMSEWGVNNQFAKSGEDTYSIWLWKGGKNCHHRWVREIYKRKRVKGRFLPNDGLDNDEIISAVRALEDGVSFKDLKMGWSKASTPTIDLQ
jgi:hypothetical protein